MAGWGRRGNKRTEDRMGRKGEAVTVTNERHEWPGDRPARFNLDRLLRLEQEIIRFRNGYTAFGSPERHELDRILADEEGK